MIEEANVKISCHHFQCGFTFSPCVNRAPYEIFLKTPPFFRGLLWRPGRPGRQREPWDLAHAQTLFSPVRRASSRLMPNAINCRRPERAWFCTITGGTAIPGSRLSGLGPVSRKPRKGFGPVKPFSVHLYLKTKNCIRLKLLVWREPPFIFRIIMWIKQLCNLKVRDFATALRARKVSGAFEKRPPVMKSRRLFFCV